MKTLSKYFLSHDSDDRIDSIHQLFAKVLSKNRPDHSESPDLRGLIQDANGMLRGFGFARDHRVFIKMCYPSIQFLLSQFINEYLNDGYFVCYLMGEACRCFRAN